MASTEAREELWGSETRKAIDNFPVSGEPIPVPVARWLGLIKAAAAEKRVQPSPPFRWSKPSPPLMVS